MASTTVPSLALLAVVACTSPDVTVDVVRGSATTMSMTLCPVGMPGMSGVGGCDVSTRLFAPSGGTATTVHEDIYIDNGKTFLLLLSVDTTCVGADVAVGTQVAVRYTGGDPSLTCTPTTACTADPQLTSCPR